MKKDKADAKEKLLLTVVELLEQNKDASLYTNREIASMAGVNSALINYYFQSKENLLNKAVERRMQDMKEAFFVDDDKNLGPEERLRKTIKTFAGFTFKYHILSVIAVSSEVKSGSLYTTQIIKGSLKEIFGTGIDETSLKLMAMQIIIPLQHMFLHREKFEEELGFDFNDEEKRNTLLDKLIDNVLDKKL